MIVEELVKVAQDLTDGGWEEVGPVTIDSGILMVGDPGYLPSYTSQPDNQFGKDWDEFLDNHDDIKEPTTINRAIDDEPGLAVVWPNGGGDGQRTVYMKRDKDDQITEVRIASVLLRMAKDLIPEYSRDFFKLEENSDE